MREWKRRGKRREKVAAQAGTGVKKMLTHIKAELPKAKRRICQCSPGSSSPCSSTGQLFSYCSPQTGM